MFQAIITSTSLECANFIKGIKSCFYVNVTNSQALVAAMVSHCCG
uniref:Uncharacterized protein n=1 Tax=Rhizophora mucronata TaxID=61149 RepID=A0A2P2IXL3_RHIMU